MSQPFSDQSPATAGTNRIWRRPLQIGLVVLLALALRLWAAWQLPVDADEPVYIRAATHYAQAFAQDGLNGVSALDENLEHPPLVKLLYAVAIGSGDPGFNRALFATRLVSVLFGTLTVALTAWLDPLAGLLMAGHSMTVKYTSQAYLEALPQLASLAALFCLSRSKRRKDAAFWLAGVWLGITAAAKYSYAPVLAPFVYLYFWRKKYGWKELIPLFGLAGVVFLGLSPSLWPDPLGRLLGAVVFHAQYTQGSEVQRLAYPWYQSVLWFTRAYPAVWHPNVFFYLPQDGLVSLLALAGLRWDWKERGWPAVWLGAALLALLVWPTKWPQYTLTATPALCLLAALAVRKIFVWAREKESYWGVLEALLPHPARWVKILAGLGVGLALLGQVILTLSNAYQQRGWWHLTSKNTPLPADQIFAIVRGADNEMAVGTARGLALAEPDADSQYPETWRVYTQANSALPGDRVQALLRGADGTLWLGTDGGLAAIRAGQWTVYQEADFGLAGAEVLALAQAADGELWVGAAAGLAVFDGRTWRAIPLNGLIDRRITALAVRGDGVWVGTSSGLIRVERAGGDAWRAVPRAESGLGAGGIAGLLVDSQDRLWVASLGGGLARLDGAGWRVWNVTNSELPYNTVTSLAESSPGVYWIGATPPTEVGGVLLRFENEQWTPYAAGRSGFSGADPVSVAPDANGHLWVGTRSRGIDIFLKAD